MARPDPTSLRTRVRHLQACDGSPTEVHSIELQALHRDGIGD